MSQTESPEVGRVLHLLASRSKYVIGIDEVGMGALAGPIAVGAVVTKVGWFHELVKDSKKYTSGKKATAHQKRLRVLEEIIKPQVEYYCHIKMTSHELDEHGIRDAWLRCLWVVATKCLKLYPDAVVVVDGSSTGSVPTPNVLAIPKGDSLVPAVSAASVLAKVERDKVMQVANEIYPEYGFGHHVGYGTEEHMVALREHGPCPIHRRSYAPIKKAVAEWQRTKQRRSEMPDSTP
jgi:ribonuclease HII